MRVALTLLLAASMVAGPAVFAGDGPATRPVEQRKAATRRAQESGQADTADQAAVRASLELFFAKAAAREPKEATALCHATSEDEQVLALALATLLCCDKLCQKAVEVYIGPFVADEAFPNQIGVAHIRRADVVVKGERATVRFATGSAFPFVKVGGAWKLSMRGLCAQEKQPANVLVSGYLQMAEGVEATVKDVQAGKVKTAAEIHSAIQTHVDEAGERVKARARERAAKAG